MNFFTHLLVILLGMLLGTLKVLKHFDKQDMAAHLLDVLIVLNDHHMLDTAIFSDDIKKFRSLASNFADMYSIPFLRHFTTSLHEQMLSYTGAPHSLACSVIISWLPWNMKGLSELYPVVQDYRLFMKFKPITRVMESMNVTRESEQFRIYRLFFSFYQVLCLYVRRTAQHACILRKACDDCKDEIRYFTLCHHHHRVVNFHCTKPGCKFLSTSPVLDTLCMEHFASC